MGTGTYVCDNCGARQAPAGLCSVCGRARPDGLDGPPKPPPSRRARGLGLAPARGRDAQLLVLDLALELLQRAAQVAADGGRGDVLGEPAAEAGAGDAVAQAQLDVGAAEVALAQAPAAALVDAGDASSRRGRARLVVLDDLDEPADLGRADAHEHLVARAEAASAGRRRPPSASRRT